MPEYAELADGRPVAQLDIVMNDRGFGDIATGANPGFHRHPAHFIPHFPRQTVHSTSAASVVVSANGNLLEMKFYATIN